MTPDVWRETAERALANAVRSADELDAYRLRVVDALATSYQHHVDRANIESSCGSAPFADRELFAARTVLSVALTIHPDVALAVHRELARRGVAVRA